jgi:transcription-repair coupling factor (superfamily II helicase)
VIETPPENRFPVQTYVVEHSPSLVREAIERELARGGQVYYLFNRVQGIYQMAEQISMLVPDARVVVAHGQMSESELERTILEFLDGEHDVLVSTSIIETGVDIPNVNTLIVHDADKMGLSQLYQLRGRVGRSNRIAYAYFTYQRDKVLNEAAEKRLQSIKEFTELGSGFKIAMRDLAIRGAGNLLGAEQHGFIAGVGFDLYSQMLAEEIRKRKREVDGEEPAEEPLAPTTIELPIEAYLPSEYIYDSMQKIEIYKKVAAVQSDEEIDDLLDELVDRFGEPPLAVRNLLKVARLRVYGTLMGLDTIGQKGEDLVLTFHTGAQTDGQILAQIAQSFEQPVELVQGVPMKALIKCRRLSLADSVELCERFLVQYKEAVHSKGEELHNVAQ